MLRSLRISFVISHSSIMKDKAVAFQTNVIGCALRKGRKQKYNPQV